jgi:integrase
MDDEWGTLVWLVMTTGMRRGEVCALRWSRVDLEEGIIDVRRSYSLRNGVGTEKDTKTHQMRRIALDTETVALLREHKQRCADRLADLGLDLTDEMYVFGGVMQVDPATPYSPHAVSSRYKGMAKRLGIDTHIHALRHYSATELLSAGIDLRTVAGRLGHGGGGATTLRLCRVGSRLRSQGGRNPRVPHAATEKGPIAYIFTRRAQPRACFDRVAEKSSGTGGPGRSARTSWLAFDGDR